MDGSESVLCQFCKSDIPSDASKCRHCGEWVKSSEQTGACSECGTPLKGEWAATGRCAHCSQVAVVPAGSHPVEARKSNSVVVTAIFGSVFVALIVTILFFLAA